MTTTERGYGWAHQQVRQRWLPVVERGDAYCTEPVCLEPTRWIEPGTPWHLAHDDDTPGEYLGPAHPRCNVAKSNLRMANGNARQRECIVCGAVFQASSTDQRTCGRACGWELRRRNNPPQRQHQPAIRRSARCEECGTEFTTTHPRKVTCSNACSTKRNRRKSAEYYHSDAAYREATLARSRGEKVTTADVRQNGGSGFKGHNALTPHYISHIFSGDSPRFSGIPIDPRLLWESHLELPPVWLARYLDVPENAAPPLAMTPVHPRATDSYGPEAIVWAEEMLGHELRWWQRLAVVRQLEHDEDGQLCWPNVIESASRRVGKSVRLRTMALWRLAHADLFGEPQLAVHIGKDLFIVREILFKALVWARAQEWGVKTGMGQEQIFNGQHKWYARSPDTVYGYDVTLGMVDESWGVKEQAITDGLEPAMLERLSPQLVLTSTAHRKSTGLMRGRVKDALTSVDEETLLLLWAAPDDADVGLMSTWRAASAHWSEQRGRVMAAKYAKASTGQQDEDFDDPDPMAGFTSQYLNRWQLGATRPGTVIDPALWAECAVAAEHAGEASYAVEVETGLRSAAIASAGATDDGRVWVDVERREGIEWVAARLTELGVPTVALDGVQDDGAAARSAAAALLKPLENAGILVKALGTADAITACGRFQADVLERRIINPDRPVLNDAVKAAQKREIGDQGGWVFGRKASGRDISALQACAWAKWLHDQGAHYDVSESFL